MPTGIRHSKVTVRVSSIGGETYVLKCSKHAPLFEVKQALRCVRQSSEEWFAHRLYYKDVEMHWKDSLGTLGHTRGVDITLIVDPDQPPPLVDDQEYLHFFSTRSFGT